MGSRMPCSAVQRLLWKSGRLQLSDWMGMSFEELRVSGQVLFDGATAIMLRLLSSKLTA